MKSNSNLTVERLYEIVLGHAYKTANYNNRPLNGYIRDIGYRSDTFYSLQRQCIPRRQKFALFLTLLTDYLNTNQIYIEHGK